MTDHVADELSAYVDDELGPAERARVERHAAACPECAGELEALRQVAARARALPDREPAAATADRLWAGIAAAARFPERPETLAAADAVVTRQAAPIATRRRRTITFSIPQLVAAGLALALLSGGVAWQVLRQRARTPVIAQGPAEGARPAADLVAAAAVAPVDFATPQYTAAVGELERVLRENRGRLEPATVEAIEQSLATIDRAIGQARAALARDPGNAYLNDHLAATMARKLELLRDAAFVAGGQS